MKKALAILMVLATVTGVVFAEDAAATFGNNSAVAVEGDATLTWGIDLENDGNTGFKNESNWKISIPLLGKQDFTHKGEGDAYATIEIDDAEYNIVSEDGAKDGFTGGDKDVDEVIASLYFGKVYVTINGKPDFSPNNVELFAPIKNDGYFDDDTEGKLLRFEPGFSGDCFGTKIGYKAEKYDVALKLASKWAYDNTTYYQDANADGVTDGTKEVLSTEKSKYAFGIDATVTPIDMLTVAGTFNYANWKRTTTSATDGKFDDGIMTVGAKVTAKPIDGLEINAAFDGTNDAIVADKNGKVSDVFAFEANASAKYKFIEAGVYYASASTPYTSKLLTTKADDEEGSTVVNTFTTNNNWFGAFDKDLVNIGDMAFFAKLTDGDYVENLDAWFTFMMYNPSTAWGELTNGTEKIGASTPIMIGLGANYKYALNDVNFVKPFFELYGQNDLACNDDDDADKLAMLYTTDKNGKLVKSAFQTAISIGADYGLFSNTTITAKYEAGSTVDNHALQLLDDTMANDKGTITFACKVVY